MTDHKDDGLDGLENEPVFICSQLRLGETLTQGDVDAIQAILSELDRIENENVDDFARGRLFGIQEVGGADLVAAVEAKEDARITKIVRETMIKMDARTREIKAATPPAPVSNVVGENQPRYTTKRLHDEIAKAKAYGIELAAQVAETGDWYGSFQTAGDERRAKDIAARIRALTPSEGVTNA